MFEASSWASCVQRSFVLTRVFRQLDPLFVDVLNSIRLGHAPPEVRAALKPCEGRRLATADGIVATRLFTHKADCATLNEEQLNALSGEKVTFRASDTGRDDAALSQLRASCPSPATLDLKMGAQVILVKTLDADGGLVNGARGVVTRFLSTRHPAVRFDNGLERTIRLEAFTLSQGGQTVACRMQLPLALGWAISIVRRWDSKQADPTSPAL